MTRRARISWLLNSAAPRGRTVMAARRMQVLGTQHDVAGFTLDPPAGVPRHSPLAGLRGARTLAGEARLARSDVIVTTSESSAASAVSRMTPGTRVVHLLHDTPRFALSTIRFMRSVPWMSHVVVPMSVDPADFATRAGLPAHRVSAMDDFVLESESLLGSARATVALLAGRLDDSVRDVVDAFRIALPRLTGWQLRVLGSGPAYDEVDALVEREGLGNRILLFGDVHDASAHYADAGVVIRVDPSDVNGLSVLESLAAGVPVLGGSGVPAVRRLVRNGHNGVVLDRIDPVAIAEGLVAFADIDRRAQFAARARADRAGLLTPTAEDELRSLFAQVLDNPASRGGAQ